MKQNGINWEQARARLRASEMALEQSLASGPAQVQAIYRKRAERLARGVGQSRATNAGLPVLVFWLGRERYAIEVPELAEALPFERCRPAPGSPPWVCGVMNVRGEIRAVMDLGRLVTPSAAGAGAAGSGFVLMLRRPGREIGLKVDRIEELREIRPEDLGHASPGRYVKATAADGLMLLDLEAVEAEVFSKEESLSK